MNFTFQYKSFENIYENCIKSKAFVNIIIIFGAIRGNPGLVEKCVHFIDAMNCWLLPLRRILHLDMEM